MLPPTACSQLPPPIWVGFIVSLSFSGTYFLPLRNMFITLLLALSIIFPEALSMKTLCLDCSLPSHSSSQYLEANTVVIPILSYFRSVILRAPSRIPQTGADWGPGLSPDPHNASTHRTPLLGRSACHLKLNTQIKHTTLLALDLCSLHVPSSGPAGQTRLGGHP